MHSAPASASAWVNVDAALAVGVGAVVVEPSGSIVVPRPRCVTRTGGSPRATPTWLPTFEMSSVLPTVLPTVRARDRQAPAFGRTSLNVMRVALPAARYVMTDRAVRVQ
jgi:hypothetical protein